jgi:hypothetical protein
MVPDMSQVRIAIALLVILAASSAGGQRTTEIFEPHHRLAEELMPIARAAIGEGGEAILDSRSNSVILIGPGDAVQRALDLLRRQDRGTPVLLLRYQTLTLAQLTRSGLEIEWESGAGLGVGRTQGTGSAKGGGRLYRTGERESFEGQLRIQSGSVG